MPWVRHEHRYTLSACPCAAQIQWVTVLSMEVVIGVPLVQKERTYGYEASAADNDTEGNLLA